MKINYLIIPFCIVGAASSYGQVLQSDVKPSAGDDFKNDKVQISWTLGETLTETLGAASALHLSQGFHQPSLKITSIEQEAEYKTSLSVFPNPVINYVTVSLKDAAIQPLRVELFDMRGTTIHKGEIRSESYTIDMSGFTNGTYMLRMYNGNQKIVSSFKIEKLK